MWSRQDDRFPSCYHTRLALAVLTLKFFLLLFFIYFATHKQHYKELIKRRKEGERMMTTVARKPMLVRAPRF